MRSAEYQRGYDAGYKQGLLDALKQQGKRIDELDRRTFGLVRLGGPRH